MIRRYNIFYSNEKERKEGVRKVKQKIKDDARSELIVITCLLAIIVVATLTSFFLSSIY